MLCNVVMHCKKLSACRFVVNWEEYMKYMESVRVCAYGRFCMHEINIGAISADEYTKKKKKIALIR